MILVIKDNFVVTHDRIRDYFYLKVGDKLCFETKQLQQNYFLKNRKFLDK